MEPADRFEAGEGSEGEGPLHPDAGLGPDAEPEGDGDAGGGAVEQHALDVAEAAALEPDDQDEVAAGAEELGPVVGEEDFVEVLGEAGVGLVDVAAEVTGDEKADDSPVEAHAEDEAGGAEPAGGCGAMLCEEDGGEHEDGEEGGLAEGDVDGEAEQHGGPEALKRKDGADAEERGVGQVVGVPVVGGGAEGDGDAHDDEDEDVGEPPGAEGAAATPPEGGEHKGGERGEAEEQAHELLRRDGLVEEGADLDGDGIACGGVAEGGTVAGPAEERHEEGAALVGKGCVTEGVLAPVKKSVIDEEVRTRCLEGGEGEEEGNEPVAAGEGASRRRAVALGRRGAGGRWWHTRFTVQQR